MDYEWRYRALTTGEYNTSYEPFSKEPEYIEGNRAFVRELPFDGTMRVLDLACGTGAISAVLLEEHPMLSIVGLDLSRESLSLARADFLNAGMCEREGVLRAAGTGASAATVVLLEGTADQLPMVDEWADAVFMGHSIHMLPNPDLLLEEIWRVLVPGGLFAFNSSFYAGSQAPGTDHFYQLWWKRALTYILEKDAELKRSGLPGLKRKRGTAVRNSTWPRIQDWRASLDNHGLEVASVNERTIKMTQSSFETIGSYAGFSTLMLSGYPPELASEAMVRAVAPAMTEFGATELPRLWLEVSARKRGRAGPHVPTMKGARQRP
jgi:ubiquinone/menaquinone biosynthesis C-methylase UbiE